MAFEGLGLGMAIDPFLPQAMSFAQQGISPTDVLRQAMAFQAAPQGPVNAPASDPFTGGTQQRPVMPSVQSPVALPGGPAGPATSGGDVFGLPSVSPQTVASTMSVPANPAPAAGGTAQNLLDTLKNVKVQQPPVTPQPQTVRPPDPKDIKEQNMLAILNSLLLQRPQLAAPSLGAAIGR